MNVSHFNPAHESFQQVEPDVTVVITGPRGSVRKRRMGAKAARLLAAEKWTGICEGTRVEIEQREPPMQLDYYEGMQGQ